MHQEQHVAPRAAGPIRNNEDILRCTFAVLRDKARKKLELIFVDIFSNPTTKAECPSQAALRQRGYWKLGLS